MSQHPEIENIRIRTVLKTGDIGNIVYLHAVLYQREYGYGLGFESYVAKDLAQFCEEYDDNKDRVWICEDANRIVGFLALVHRGDVAQLRFFILEPACRGIGLGNKLLTLYMKALRELKYKSSYLWTTHELPASAHLYKKFGFRLTEEKPTDAFGKPVMLQRYDFRVE